MRSRWFVRAMGWSLTWAVGVAAGVALGAYLTTVGAAAAPGATVLGSTELVLLPVLAGAVVFVVSLAGRGLFRVLRRPATE